MFAIDAAQFEIVEQLNDALSILALAISHDAQKAHLLRRHLAVPSLRDHDYKKLLCTLSCMFAVTFGSEIFRRKLTSSKVIFRRKIFFLVLPKNLSTIGILNEKFQFLTFERDKLFVLLIPR